MNAQNGPRLCSPNKKFTNYAYFYKNFIILSFYNLLFRRTSYFFSVGQHIFNINSNTLHNTISNTYFSFAQKKKKKKQRK